jgi:transcription initiation factor TFIID TATA-box-binding protein
MVNGSLLIFKNGKIVIAGAKSPEKAEKAAIEAQEFIREKGYPNAKMENFKINNMVFSVDLGFHLNLYKIGKCSYEPELFPGAKIVIENSKAIILAFTSGKLIITGADNFEEAQRAFVSVKPRLDMAKHDIS